MMPSEEPSWLENASFIPCGKFGSPYLGKVTAAARAALPIPYSACGIFVWSIQRYGCQCLGYLTCAQMLLHAIAHEGCTDTVRESTLKVDSGRKIPCRSGDSNLPKRCAGPTLYQLSYIPAPILLLLLVVCCCCCKTPSCHFC